MDGKRLMVRNVYQVFRCFRNIIRFSSIQASGGWPRKFFAKIKPPSKPLVVVTVHISKGSLHKVRESLQASFVQLFYFAASALCSTTRELSFSSPPPLSPSPHLVWPLLASIMDSLFFTHTYIYITFLSLFCISFYLLLYLSLLFAR